MKKIPWLLLSFVISVSTLSPGIVTAEPATASAVHLDHTEQKRLNLFLSNFSEVFVEPFQQNQLTDSTLIRFGVAHNYRNRSRLFEELPGGGKARIRASHVNASAQQYFGRRIRKHQSVGEYQYKEGYYYVVQASGEVQQFSQATHMVDLGNNRYAVDVNIYAASSGWMGDIHGTPASWKRSGEDVPERIQQMKAVIAKVTAAKGKPSYILLDYLKP